MTRGRQSILVGLVAGLVLLQASPAFAYKWKRTVTVGVDPNGVPVQIDARASSAGSSTSGSGGGGGRTPCTYTLASVGGPDSAYAGQRADVGLFTIRCGSYTDVRFLRLGPGGNPVLPGARVDPYQLALSGRDRLPLPAGGIKANPTRSLVGLPTWFWYLGYEGRPLTKTVSAFGTTVQVQATPTAFRWDFGDGATMTSADLGRAYPQHSTIAHVYQTARPSLTVTCTFDFAVRWRTAGGPWTPLAPLTRTATATFQVAQSQTVIGQ